MSENYNLVIKNGHCYIDSKLIKKAKDNNITVIFDAGLAPGIPNFLLGKIDAKENIKSEKTDIRIEGIKVNKEKNIIYFLFAIEPFTLIFTFIEFEISLKINMK